MNEDRIQINGTWYVKEDQEDTTITLNLTNFEGCVVENNQVCFEAIKTFKDDKNYYDYIDIKFTDKRVKPWKKEHWDNNDWLIGILNYDSDALKELPDITAENIKLLQVFLKHLKDKEWL
jgi:hypothetical protein